MEVSTPIPWLFDLDMDELLLFQEPYGANCLVDYLLPQHIENISKSDHNHNHHHHQSDPSLCSSTESNSNVTAQQAAVATVAKAAAKSKPSKQTKVHNKTTNTKTTKKNLPVILNFGSSALCNKDNKEDHHQQQQQQQQEYETSFKEDNYDQEQDEDFMYVNHEDVINEEPPPKRKYNKRTPSTTTSREHILAERRRREKLSQSFAALSALIPGLTRMDKTSILAEAIQHLKKLQENIRVFEEESTGRSVESMMILKKHQFSSSDKQDANSSCCQEYLHSTTQGQEQLPEIEAKISNKNLLFKIACEKRDAILIRILGAIEKHQLSLTSVHASPFGDKTLNVNIIAQLDKEIEIRLQAILQDLSLACRKC